MALPRRPSSADMNRAIDQRTLLPDEDPKTAFLEDALHWILVYTELLEFKATMIDAAAHASVGMSAAAHEDTTVDRDMLRAQAERYRLRCEFWTDRAARMRAAEA